MQGRSRESDTQSMPQSRAEASLVRFAPLRLAVLCSFALTSLFGKSTVHADYDSVRGSLEIPAIKMAAALGSVALAEGVRCPNDRLAVSWEEPRDGFERGAHLSPVGPAPTRSTKSVNGVVVCRGSQHSYMGFEAFRTPLGWKVVEVPDVASNHDEEEENDPSLDPPLQIPPMIPTPAPQTPTATPPTVINKQSPLTLPDPSMDGIDGYSPYQPQTTCDSSAKAGVVDFRNLVLAKNPGTSSSGIVRGCSVGGRSEHKEGRAWDWHVSAFTQKQSAEAVVDWLLATDSAGNRHAMARRMGVMYIIWNRQMWASYRPFEGWRPYSGASPHTDHVHFSFSWEGARKQTSYWSGRAIDTSFLPGAGPGSRPSGTAHERKALKRQRPPAKQPFVSHKPPRRERLERRLPPRYSEPQVTATASPSPRQRRRRITPSPSPAVSTRPIPPEPSPSPSPSVAPTLMRPSSPPAPPKTADPAPTKRPSPDPIKKSRSERTHRWSPAPSPTSSLAQPSKRPSSEKKRRQSNRRQRHQRVRSRSARPTPSPSNAASQPTTTTTEPRPSPSP